MLITTAVAYAQNGRSVGKAFKYMVTFVVSVILIHALLHVYSKRSMVMQLLPWSCKWKKCPVYVVCGIYNRSDGVFFSLTAAVSFPSWWELSLVLILVWLPWEELQLKIRYTTLGI
jgi:hypothetical protein